MRVIYKYPFDLAKEFELLLPKDWVFRHLGYDISGTPCIWAEVKQYDEKEIQKFRVVGTGQEVPKEDEGWFHLGTIITVEYLVWHIFYKIEEEGEVGHH